jgi:hypothetical protein
VCHLLLPRLQEHFQRLAGNCELRSIVMASHGVRDGQQLRKMKEYSTPSSQPLEVPSTVDFDETLVRRYTQVKHRGPATSKPN